MVADQMLVIVTPLDDLAQAQAKGALLDRPSVRKDLDALFQRQGCVHYATFMLLPPSPDGVADPGGHALALSLAIDAGLTAEALVDDLCAINLDLLLDLYGGSAGLQGSTAQALADYLLDPAHLRGATGGYVGPRDRSVAQIREEAALAGALRGIAGAAPVPDVAPPVLAAQWAGRLRADPRFGWAAKPAPTSSWRRDVAPDWLRLALAGGWLLTPLALLVAVAALALVGHLSQFVLAAAYPHIAMPGAVAQAVARGFTPCAVFLQGKYLGVALRVSALVLVLAIALASGLSNRSPTPVLTRAILWTLILLVVVLALLAGLAVLETFFSPVPGLGPEADFTARHVEIGALVLAGFGVVALLLVASFGAVLLVMPPSLPARLRAASWFAVLPLWLLSTHVALALGLRGVEHFGWVGSTLLAAPGLWEVLGVHWTIPVVDWAALAGALLLLAIGLVLYEVARLGAGPWSEKLNRPIDQDPPDPFVQQTAPSIDACEAALVQQTAFMVSLTEVRQPFARNADLAALFLKVISRIGWYWYSEGSLGGLYSIQFAHWTLIDKGRRLLFCANFDGDFGGYLDDFIVDQFPLINVIWRWTCLGRRPGIALGGRERDARSTRPRPFPKTRLWLFAGCFSELVFKSYARESMLPFQYHFAAYDLRLRPIVQATRLRNALTEPSDIANADVILRSAET